MNDLRVCVALLTGAVALAAAAIPAQAGDPFLRHSTTVRVVKEVGPSVVSITTEQTVQRAPGFGGFSGNPYFDSFFRDFFVPGLPQTTQSLGSGVLIDAEGHILTNAHVVSQATRIRVALADGTELDAEVIGADPNNDVAVIRVKSESTLPWYPPGSSNDLMVGESVIAIGNPFGLSNTVTTGVISAMNRSVRTQDRIYHGFLQTDASINPGNSGGPLVDAEGRIVAINTAIYGGAQGIGFAIPIDAAMRVVRELIEHGEVTPVWLGLEFQDLNPGLADVMGLPDDLRGALVNRVRKDSPAKRARLRRGDVVTKVDDRPVVSAVSFYEMLRTSVDGQEIEVELMRGGSSETVTVTLEEIPVEHVERLLSEMLGLTLEPQSAGGYVVKGVREGSGSARIGIQGGDLVLSINGHNLSDSDALRRSVLDLRGRSQALVMVQRGAGRYHVAIPLV